MKFVDGKHQLPPTDIFSDSTAALSLDTSSQILAKSKHIETKNYHSRSLVETGIVILHLISASEQVADLLTKPMD